ncbi:hypothetical protein [Pseudomaricurvus alcaniphilus]|nr:hypothetical protein [Pseudomaricurvus alcaniphilus]
MTLSCPASLVGISSVVMDGADIDLPPAPAPFQNGFRTACSED